MDKRDAPSLFFLRKVQEGFVITCLQTPHGSPKDNAQSWEGTPLRQVLKKVEERCLGSLVQIRDQIQVHPDQHEVNTDMSEE